MSGRRTCIKSTYRTILLPGGVLRQNVLVMPAGMATASFWDMDIWKLIYGHLPDEDLVKSRLICKEFDGMLRLLVKEICIRKPIAQSSLESLANTYPNLAVLHISLEYEDETEPLFLENVHLPNLRDLRLSCCPLHSIVFTEANTPSLVSLSIENQGPPAENFNVSLPELTHMDIQHVQAMLFILKSAALCRTGNLLYHGVGPSYYAWLCDCYFRSCPDLGCLVHCFR